MPRPHHTPVTLEAPKGSFGPRDRFIDQHGLPGRRKEISETSLKHKYKQIKKLNDTGALNEGIWKIQKLEGQRAGKLCVLKKISYSREEGRLLLREIEILHVLKHPNIVGFIEACIPRGSEGIAELFLEYCDQGDLQNVLSKYIKYNMDYCLPYHPWEWIPEGFVWHVFRSLASALAYLHYGVRHDDMDNPPRIDRRWPYILHRDIKPENILLKSRPSNSDTLPQRSNYPTVVLADFVSLSWLPFIIPETANNQFAFRGSAPRRMRVNGAVTRTTLWGQSVLSDGKRRSSLYTRGQERYGLLV